MNYDLSFISSDGSDLQEIISILNSMESILTTSDKNLVNNWIGLSYNKYKGLSDSLKGRYQEKVAELNEVIGLLGLVRQHNSLREERASCESKIASLRPRLYYIEYNDEGEEISVYNEDIGKQISQLEQRIKEINGQMDEVIAAIKGITGG